MDTNTLAIITKVGEKIEGIAEFAWPVLVREQEINGWASLVILFLSFCLIISGFYFGVKHWEKKNFDTGMAFFIASGVLGSFFLLKVTFDSAEIANQIFNPEAIAIRRIIGK